MSQVGVDVAPLQFRDPQLARRLFASIAAEIDACDATPVRLMHVCGSHEQAIARYGLRSNLPPGLDLSMGPGCPVCVTDGLEIDSAVGLARSGVHVATYGDMLGVPGTAASLAAVRAEGAPVHVVYSILDAVELARRQAAPVVFFATGFETTAVATAAALLAGVPDSFSVLSAHKYVPAAMQAVAELPQRRIAGFLAAGHAATITGAAVFRPLAATYQLPIVVGGFEPLDILAGLLRLVQMVRRREPGVSNTFQRCVTEHGNRRALESLWRVFELDDGIWRGLSSVPAGSLCLRREWRHADARIRHADLLARLPLLEAPAAAALCRCGEIMTGMAQPTDCAAYAKTCRPEAPLGACMVSSEGTCRIWFQYGSPANREPT